MGEERKITIKPNLFIVGAPKCGTTSLYEYLRTHPAVFMSGTRILGCKIAG